MREASASEIEYAMYVDEFCFDCRRWRDDPCAKTQCKIAGYAAVGENYKGYWKEDNGEVYCEKWKSREIKKKKEKSKKDQEWLVLA